MICLSGLALETLPSDGAGEFYEEAAGGRSAFHHLQVKARGSFRDLPLTRELPDSLGGWFALLESVKGVRLRRGRGVNFAGATLVFPGRNGAPFSNEAFNARIKLACQRARLASSAPVRCHAMLVLSSAEIDVYPLPDLAKIRLALSVSSSTNTCAISPR